MRKSKFSIVCRSLRCKFDSEIHSQVVSKSAISTDPIPEETAKVKLYYYKNRVADEDPLASKFLV